ncbi:hypothetical protein KQX64_20770 [Rhodopseudomonas palustris]|nr:hypothetical protein KQX64_20770 [Rhodopseudomonas palustris]
MAKLISIVDRQEICNPTLSRKSQVDVVTGYQQCERASAIFFPDSDDGQSPTFGDADSVPQTAKRPF